MESVEIWKKHPLSKYLISSLGNVMNPDTGKPIKCFVNKAGYRVVAKRVTKGSRGVHRAMMEAFFGLIPENLVVNHIDGNKLNNTLSNLEVVTSGYNTKHAYELGLAKGRQGESHHSNKITEDQLLEMYQLFELGYNNDYVGDQFGLHSRYVSLIRHGKRWEHIYKRENKIFPKSFTVGAYSLSKIVEAWEMLKQGHTNKVVSDAVGIEASCVSRLRSGNLWKDFIDFYENKPLTRSTT